jgi:hypothetical protein
MQLSLEPTPQQILTHAQLSRFTDKDSGLLLGTSSGWLARLAYKRLCLLLLSFHVRHWL